MNLRNYLEYLAWGTRDLARHAEINDRTAARALNGDVIRPWVAQRIAAALSKALKKRVLPGDIEDLNIEKR